MGIRRFEDQQAINRSKRMGVVARTWQDRPTTGHQIFAAKIVAAEENDRWSVELFGGTAGESTGAKVGGAWAPGQTVEVGDWVTVRIAAGQAPLIIVGGGGSEEVTLPRHSHSGPSDGGWQSSFDGDY